MARLDDVLARLDVLKNFVVTIDQGVEQLYELIKQNAGGDISEDAQALLLAKIEEIQAAADKVLVDDEPPQE